MTDHNIQLINRIDIPQIAYPKEFKSELQGITDRLVAGIKTEVASSVEDGQGIPLGPLPKELDISFTFFLWITDTNEIIDNLNIALSDFRDLAEKHFLFDNHRKRVYLILRTFFYEFFRIKEVFNKFTKEMRRLGLLRKDDLSALRQEFVEVFKDVIAIRNKLVHDRFGWPGKENVDLIIVSTLNDFGYAAVKKETSQEIKINDALSLLYNKLVPTLLVEAMLLSKTIQNMVDHLMDVVRKTDR